MARINIFGRPLSYDVGVTYRKGFVFEPSAELHGGGSGHSAMIGTPKILEPGIDDLSQETKELVVQNASDITHGANDPTHKNRYPVGAGYNQTNLNDSSGNPAPFDSAANTTARTNGTGAQFVESTTDQDLLKNYSNSTVTSARTLKNPGTISPTLKKGKQIRAPGEHDGNTLLRDGIDKIQETYVSPILSNNRFTATSQRSANPTLVRVNPTHPADTLGSYRNFVESPGGKDVTAGHFANLGVLLSVRATSELASSTGYGQDGPDGLGASAAALLPGTAQIGLIKVDVDDLRANEAFKSLIEDDTDPVNLNPGDANDHLINNTGSSSFGQMNNVLEPFSGLLPLGMIAASTALVIGMKLALKGLTVLLAAITSAKQGNVKKDSQGRYILGSYMHSAGKGSSFPPLPIPASLLGLTITEHDFEDCVDEGISLVFGGGLGSSFDRVLETPGFYGVICRNIVRSAANIVIQVQNAVKGNPIQIAQNIIELINVIRSSKVIAAINIMAKLGDSTLTLKDRPAQKEEFLGITKYSTVDALDDNFRVGKGRMQGRLQSALATSTSPSVFLFPRQTVSALTAFSNRFPNSVTPASVAAVKSQTNKDGVNSELGDTSNRISTDAVKSIEANLDAEYMPFYFHDLRTNEIVSFHAFLRSMSDDYTVETETIKAFGRVDPVKIYKSTDRKISIEFYVVATNKQDFDQMWWKINKLVTLVYPQWSKGNVLTNPETKDKFIQPFSQTPTNSPLIRLRLGDLFRTNYSRFALARLFGLGEQDAFFDVKINDDGVAKLVEFARILDTNDLESLRDAVVSIHPGLYPIKTAKASVGISLGGKSKNAPASLVAMQEPAKIAEKEDEGLFVVQMIERTAPGDEQFIIVPVDQISISRESLAKVLKSRLSGAGSVSNTATLSKINDFLNPSKNSVVRSFEASGGKGLACMIDNLGFNWLDNIPWETEAYGSRAPKMCVVKMSLTPIHDIAPGLDVNGFNRAPVYNVGEIMNGIAGDGTDNEGEGRTKFDDLRKKLRKVLK